MSNTGEVKACISHDMLGREVEIEAVIGYTVLSRGRPAKTQGDPSDCYPEEAAEFEVHEWVELSLGNLSWSVFFSDLPETVQQRANEMILDEIYEGQPEDDHDRDEL